MARDGFHIEPEDLDATETVVDEDVEAAEDEELEELGYGIPDDAQPESQGADPFLSEIGEDGQGDLSPEDE